MFKFSHLLAVAALTLAAQQPAWSQAPDADKVLIEKSFRDWQQALVDRDSGALERIAAPEFTQAHVGSEESRAVAIGMPTASPDYAVEGVAIEALGVRVNGDAGQLEAIALVRENYSGRIHINRLAFSQSWVRRDGGWLLVRSDNNSLE